MKKIKKSIVLIIVTLELICFGFMCTNTYAATKNGWVQIQSNTYYYVNGKPVKGKYTVKEEPAGTYYFSKKTGKRLSGWRTINQNKYYFNQNNEITELDYLTKIYLYKYLILQMNFIKIQFHIFIIKQYQLFLYLSKPQIIM